MEDCDRYEPDDFEEYNRNEADDYRHELDGDDLPDFGGPDEEDEDAGWAGEFDEEDDGDCWNCGTRYRGKKCPNGCSDIPDEARYAESATWRVEGREPQMRYCAK